MSYGTVADRGMYRSLTPVNVGSIPTSPTTVELDCASLLALSVWPMLFEKLEVQI